MTSAIDTGIVSLYKALKPGDVDLNQLGTPSQVDTLSTLPFVSLKDLGDVVDLTKRRERYAANLAYTLGTRLVGQDNRIEGPLKELGVKILGRLNALSDLTEPEGALRDALTRLASMSAPQLGSDVVDDLSAAFGGALDAQFDAPSGTWSFTGAAAETATMLVELASLQIDCQGREGHVRRGRQLIPVTVIEYEVCTQSPFSRTAPGVDPRNWTTYSPFFFDSVKVLTPAPTTTNWNGVIQESVGALLTGTPVVTNLAVSYVEQPGLAVVTYDLAPNNPSLTADDGTVTVDYGMFAVIDEGIHRRVRMLKVVHIDGHDMNHEWLCPLWAQQLAMIGWWF